MNASEIRGFFNENQCIQKLWGPQLIASFGIPLCLVVLSRIMILIRRFKTIDKMCSGCRCNNVVMVQIQLFAVRTIAGKNLFGKILAFSKLVAILATGTILIYVTYREFQKDKEHYLQVYFCIPWTSDNLLMADGCMQIIFFVDFLLSAIGTEDILAKLVSMSSIVEYATAISNITMIVIGYHNYGLRFLNYLRLTSTARIMIQLRVIRGNKNILLVKLVTSFCSFWLCGAGLFLLLNGVDDAFRPTVPNNQLRFFDTLYFLLITMSTVGYGDVLPGTIPTQTFTICFIIYALGLFASFIPQVAAILDSGGSYTGEYTRRHGLRHIVVCGGNIGNGRYVMNLVKAIYHKSRTPANNNLQIVFLSQMDPDKNLEIYLTKKWTKLTYIKGSICNTNDQQKSQLKYAETVILLVDELANENTCADTENVMRAMLVKRVNPEVQLIVQVARWQNKSWLASVEAWNPNRDTVVCVGQIRSGLLGGCGPGACIGLSTLLLNWISTHSPSKDRCQETWKKYYEMGAVYSLYEVELSNSFDFVPFKEAVKICYLQLGVILLAVNKTNQIYINPSNLKLQTNEMKVFVLAPSFEAARQLENFCPSDYGTRVISNMHLTQIDIVRKKKPKCPCSRSIVPKKREIPANQHSEQLAPSPSLPRKDYLQILLNEETSQNRSDQIGHDISGLFYWVRKRNMDDLLLSPLQAYQCQFRNHLVIISPPPSSSNRTHSLGWLQELAGQILPLRSTQIKMEHLRDIVLLLHHDYSDILTLNTIPDCMFNLPHFYIVHGSIQSQTIMEAINIHQSHSCIILNITNDTSSMVMSCHLNQSPAISNPTSQFKSMLYLPAIQTTPFIATEIKDEARAHGIIDIDREFSCGRLIPVERIDNIIFHSIFEPSCLRVLEALFSWEACGVTESIMQEPLFAMLPTNTDSTNTDTDLYKCRMCLLSVNHPLIRMDKVPELYEDLFHGLLDKWGLVCVALYREMDHSISQPFVWCCPPGSTLLQMTDQVFFLQSYSGDGVPVIPC